ncbi:hypothetical protein [Aquihabitans sp. McL0605]|uniref:hypothetical protein n=1 Tax=Aquihabitans sp. McL0605 TaxID=3415671 RepID=UPI003CF6F6C4
MGNRAVGGAVGAGCAGFSLVGILLAVGITVWLGSQATTGVSGPKHRPSSTGPGGADISPSVDPNLTLPGATLARATLTTAKAAPLGAGGGTVALTGTNFPPGPISVTACLSGGFRSSNGLAGCDVTTTATATVAADGSFRLTYPVKRVLDVLDTPNDCAAFEGACSVVAHPADAFDDGPGVPLTFAAGLPPVDGAEAPPTP